jgi:hypothetical protein
VYGHDPGNKMIVGCQLLLMVGEHISETPHSAGPTAICKDFAAAATKGRATSGEPSSAANSDDQTSALSSREATTTTGRKSRHARGADAPGPRPALPVVPPASAAASSTCIEPCQSRLSAGIRTARRRPVSCEAGAAMAGAAGMPDPAAFHPVILPTSRPDRTILGIDAPELHP